MYDLTLGVATRGGLIKEITVTPGFVAIERGYKELPTDGFRLEDHLFRRPQPTANLSHTLKR